jgi:hypothetical protein
MWKQQTPKNYKLISLSEGKRSGFHVYIEDEKCLYKVFATRTNKAGKETASLRCIENECKCRGKIIDSSFQRTAQQGSTSFQSHDHPSHSNKAEAEMMYSALKKEVLNSRRNIRELHNEMLRKLSPESASLLSWHKIGSTLKRLRRSIFPGCEDKKAFELLFETNAAIIETYGKYRGETLYQGTVGDENHRASIFVISQHLEQLEKGFSLYMDGTFSVVPLDFSQLYVLLADFEGKPRPLAFILMDSRNYMIYKHIFSFLRDALDLQPGNIMIDFELAPRKALREVWPKAAINGCNFHFAQALWRKARLLEEMKIVRQNETAKKILKMYTRLSLLPLEKIDQGVAAIEQLQRQKKLTAAFERFHSYFKKTWLDGTYSKKDWCVDGLDQRTNNHLEAYNSMIKDNINRNPSVYDFLEFIQDLCYKSNNEYEEDLAKGYEIKSRSKIASTLNTELPKLKSGLINVKTFLLRLSNI